MTLSIKSTFSSIIFYIVTYFFIIFDIRIWFKWRHFKIDFNFNSCKYIFLKYFYISLLNIILKKYYSNYLVIIYKRSEVNRFDNGSNCNSETTID